MAAYPKEEVTVEEVAKLVGRPTSTTRDHLTLLTQKGLLTKERSSRKTLYRLETIGD